MSWNNLFKRSAEYLLFGSASVWLLSWHFAFGPNLERIDIWYALLFHISIGVVVGMNAFVWIPELLAAGKRSLYLTAFVATLVGGVYLHHLTFEYLSGWLFPEYFFVSYLSQFEIGAYLLAYMLLTTLIQFSRSWFREVDLQRELMQLKQDQQEQELQLLQQQVQPHFLFNSLNSIYALVRKQSDQAERAVLVLSDLLRYTIEHAGRHEVSLRQEIEYIENYVTLQRLRHDRPETISMTIHMEDHQTENWQIVPLLLINMVENAFKHAAPAENELFIRILLECRDASLCCVVENTRDPDASVNSTGTGLINLQKRLRFFYPDAHKLEISEDANTYRIRLALSSVRPAKVGGQS